MTSSFTLVTAPEELPLEIDLFLAGGISGCRDWQQEAIKSLVSLPITVANPRRADGFAKTGPEDRDQIGWEFRALRLSKVRLFWFEASEIQPITLFELGRAATETNHHPLVVGAHPNYPRRFDVVEQLRIPHPRKGRQSHESML